MSMTKEHGPQRRTTTSFLKWAGACVAMVTLGTGCGGGNPLGNPPNVSNEAGRGGQGLSFAYFQRCINPIFLAQLPIPGSASATNTCSGSGCHDNATGTGGAFRIIPSAGLVDLTNPGNTADVIRLTDMYKNFYSSQGEVVLTAVSQSRLLNKPLVRNVLHGGGLVFVTDLDPNVRLLLYWMTHPAPVGQGEFTYDPGAGSCPTQ
jgi:predicted CxxxxCH...CXXCH cytochrome family protein